VRLTHLGHKIGLASDDRYAAVIQKQSHTDEIINYLRKTSATPGDAKALLEEAETPVMEQNMKLGQLVLRPQLDIEIMEKTSTTIENVPIGIF
jgi:tRNA uridine 5-carboxymethylaminomethyl modification enzyme